MREKAQQLIRQIKEYRRRGPLVAGVPVRSGTSTLFAVAVEPAMDDAVPWLDSSNADDRLLATAFEIARKYLKVPIAIVTADINLQNKAEFAGFPFLEPPDAASADIAALTIPPKKEH